jgi:hypothetical protein
MFGSGVSVTSAVITDDTVHVTFSGTPMAVSNAATFLSGHPKASPASVARPLAEAPVSGRVSGRGLGSPDGLLRVPRQ